MPNLDSNNHDLDTVINAEMCVMKAEAQNQDKIRHEVCNVIENIFSNSNSHRNKRIQNVHKNQKKILHQLRQKLKLSNSTIIPADKTKSIVIINNNDLNQKVQQFLDKNNLQQVNRDPTKENLKSVKEIIKFSTIIPENKKRYLTSHKISAPKFNPILKTHKPDKPIRPLIDSRYAPCYRLAKYLQNLLQNNANLNSESHLTNGYQYTNKVKDLKIPSNSKLVSFDVVDMYTSIPRDHLLTILKSNLENKKSLNSDEINELVNMVKLVINENYFEYNGKFYVNNKGLAMGAPLSSILSEIYLQHIENEYILKPNNPYHKYICYWYRYVDDTICLFKGTSRQIDNFLKYLNTLSTTVKFTKEEEENKQINFLDLTIKNNNSHHQFSIYRKKTQSDITIHNESNHPYSYKMAAYNSMVYRAITYPLCKEDFNNEISIIKQIAQNNGYKPDIIDKILKRQRKTQRLKKNNDKSTQEKKYVPVNYQDKSSEKIARCFAKNNISLAFRTHNNIRKHLNNCKQQQDKNKFKQSGVYLYQCKPKNKPPAPNHCPKKYIGLTNRSFVERYKEHTQHSAHTNPSSTVARHIKDDNCSYGDIQNHMSVLKMCTDKTKTSVYEQYYIFQHIKEEGQDNFLNVATDFHNKRTFEILRAKQNLQRPP
ncbi:hypothetical protein M8J77_005960 [Diaphorina citri]|nr:hypothetical protein M8J77_005960 [Diaphorina citri]